MDMLWIVIQVLIGYNLVLPFVLYIGTFFVRRPMLYVSKANHYQPDYAIIITAYEQSHMLPSVIQSALSLNYENFHIYVVADNCDLSNFHISDPKLSVLKPETVLASNIKSHFYAIHRFIRVHEILTIIDSDNLIDSNYLNELNRYFFNGYMAVQGVRRPKPMKTDIATLDSVRDRYYSFYDGEVLFMLGSSATLAGSGMAFNVQLYVECLQHANISGAGFDKLLQAEIVKRGHRIAYAPLAIVYDEKTSSTKQLVNQRSRWINSWFKYVGHGKNLILLGLKNRNFNQLLFGVVILRPPIFITILSSFSFFFVSAISNPIYFLVWSASMCLFVISFAIPLKNERGSRKKYFISLLSIPKFIFYQVVALIHSKNANRRSVATKH